MMNNRFEAPTPEQLAQRLDKIPDDVMVRCPVCQTTFLAHDAIDKTCPECGYGLRLGARERIMMVTDQFEEIDREVTIPARFNDLQYRQKISQAKKKTQQNESVVTGFATIGRQACGLAVMDSRFIMGSLGSATGEKLTRLFEQARQRQLPVVVFTTSGGARMQEGIHSLMQMTKVSQAVSELQAAGLAYLVVLTDPTMGGVTASFAMQGDIILAEPHTMVGFAGRRVIEQTIKQTPPADFQRAETLLEHGFIDAIVPRPQLKQTLARLLTWHAGGTQ
jgi:acetyl-CoA carboxylase carboxyl transferase subunit beta